MSRRPGAEVVEPRHERFVQALTANTLSSGTEHVTSWASRAGALTAVNLGEDGATAGIVQPYARHRRHDSVVLDDAGAKKTRELVERVADEQIAKPPAAPATFGSIPATAWAGGFLDLLTVPAYERVP